MTEPSRGTALVRAETRRVLARHPRVYMPLVRATQRRADALRAGSTSVVVEGFPRSGNTYAHALLRTAFPDLDIASHLHAVAHVREALRRRIPTVVLVREPLAAVASFSVREPGIPLPSMLRAYVDFHRRLTPSRRALVRVRFEDLVENPGQALAGMAEALGRAPVPAVDPPFLARVDALVERMEIGASHGVLDEDRVPRPSDRRASRNRQARERVLADHPTLLSRCHAAYEGFCAA